MGAIRGLSVSESNSAMRASFRPVRLFPYLLNTPGLRPSFHIAPTPVIAATVEGDVIGAAPVEKNDDYCRGRHHRVWQYYLVQVARPVVPDPRNVPG